MREAGPWVGPTPGTSGPGVDAVRNLLHQYVRGVDRHDWDLVRACFHDDATDTHNGVTRSVEGLLVDMKRRHRTAESSMHFVTNVSIEVVSQYLARSEAYCIAYIRHRAGAEMAAHTRTVRCRYLDTVERHGREPWRFSQRVVVYEAVDITPLSDRFIPSPRP
jgi:hypothetical protein